MSSQQNVGAAAIPATSDTAPVAVWADAPHRRPWIVAPVAVIAAEADRGRATPEAAAAAVSDRPAETSVRFTSANGDVTITAAQSGASGDAAWPYDWTPTGAEVSVHERAYVRRPTPDVPEIGMFS